MIKHSKLARDVENFSFAVGSFGILPSSPLQQESLSGKMASHLHLSGSNRKRNPHLTSSIPKEDNRTHRTETSLTRK